MKLEEVKEFLRIDTDVTDSDVEITGMIEAAKQYAYICTGVVYSDTPLYNMTVKLLVSHYYTHRTQDARTQYDYSHSISDLINCIELTGGVIS